MGDKSASHRSSSGALTALALLVLSGLLVACGDDDAEEPDAAAELELLPAIGLNEADVKDAAGADRQREQPPADRPGNEEPQADDAAVAGNRGADEVRVIGEVGPNGLIPNCWPMHECRVE